MKATSKMAFDLPKRAPLFRLLSLFPIGDDNSDRVIRPYVTYALIALNVAVFVLLQLPSASFTNSFAVVPAEILHARRAGAAWRIGRTLAAPSRA